MIFKSIALISRKLSHRETKGMKESKDHRDQWYVCATYAPKLWNSPPPDITQAQSVCSIKTQLRIHLFIFVLLFFLMDLVTFTILVTSFYLHLLLYLYFFYVQHFELHFYV